MSDPLVSAQSNSSCVPHEDIILSLQDLKSEKHRAQMGVARATLEKSTMMLLTTSKVSIPFMESAVSESVLCYSKVSPLERVLYHN